MHLECGKHINVYDWMQAVSELQFLGFVKPTTRKADHVIRLTYGHC
ncbi:hypothetical protein B566_EDAN013822 [Ephemera danica]|nr:hypothetical protein B566_EDAN013822 [Ephemera danica]